MRANIQKLAECTSLDDQVKLIRDSMGDIDSWFSLVSSQVLLAIYVAPERTAGGILRPSSNIDEDRWQGKAGLIIAKGPTAFKYDGAYNFEGEAPALGDWVLHFPSDGRDTDLRGIACRIIDSELIRAVIKDPTYIY